MSNAFVTTVEGIERITFEWQITQRRAAASIIPIILMELKKAAPVSASKPDGGRFKNSIGYRVESGAGLFVLKFVSTAPYAKFVLKPTAGGKVIVPQQTMALRFQDGFGDYVFASSITRGSTPGNDFNVRVAQKMQPLIKTAFKDSITIVYT